MFHFVCKMEKIILCKFFENIEIRIKKCRLLNKSQRNITKLQEYPTYM